MRYVIALVVGLSLVLGLACGGGKKTAGDPTPTPTLPGGSGGAVSATQPPATRTTSGGSSGGIPDSCSLLTDAQVATAMAESVAKKTATSSTPALSVCQWDGVTAGRRFVYVTIRAAQFGTPVFNNSFKARADAQAVSGIGKEAIAIPGQDTPNNYRFLTGAVLTDAWFIQVDVAGPNRPNADALATLTTVMRTVVSGIK